MKRNAPRWFVHIDRKIAELIEQRPEYGLRERYEKLSSHMSLCSGYNTSGGLGFDMSFQRRCCRRVLVIDHRELNADIRMMRVP